tara:strand:- start:238 stop:909 length:672 start_codon:yes stop_codon:yes gene_type:complete
MMTKPVTKRIEFANAYFMIIAPSLLYWPDHKALIVSDLHLEKGSHYAEKTGQMLPPYDSKETLLKLISYVSAIKPEKVILLGDNFHDEGGYDRLPKDVKKLWERLLTLSDLIWVEGNHDNGFVPKGVEAHKIYWLGQISFAHIFGESGAEYEISGHYHPSAILNYKGKRIRGKAFIMDKGKMIMPSFGAYTGGLDVSDPAIVNLNWQHDPSVFLSTERHIIRL